MNEKLSDALPTELPKEKITEADKDLSKWTLAELLGKLTIPQLWGIIASICILLSDAFGLGY
jgi:hypothetical protein